MYSSSSTFGICVNRKHQYGFKHDGPAQNFSMHIIYVHNNIILIVACLRNCQKRREVIFPKEEFRQE